MLFEIILAANYLDIKPLLCVLCSFSAPLVRSLTLAEHDHPTATSDARLSPT
jgi:hypothetical protein